jgi:hypothetical protein
MGLIAAAANKGSPLFLTGPSGGEKIQIYQGPGFLANPIHAIGLLGLMVCVITHESY